MQSPKKYYKAIVNTFSRVHTTNNTGNTRVTTKQLGSLLPEFLIWSKTKTLGGLPPNNSAHLFGVTNNVDNYRELLPNKIDFFRAVIDQYWHF